MLQRYSYSNYTAQRSEMATDRIDETKLAGSAQDGQGRSHELGKGGKSKRVRRELDRPTIRSV